MSEGMSDGREKCQWTQNFLINFIPHACMKNIYLGDSQGESCLMLSL